MSVCLECGVLRNGYLMNNYKMFWYRAVVLSIFLTVSWSTDDWEFPSDFKFGAASSAYQTEGGWNASDKGESIWDRFTHTRPSSISDRANGDETCDSFHHWESDIEMAVELGLQFYRFSISWSRLLPTGFMNNVSEDGTQYYDNVINGLLEKNIEPFVTLYNLDLPQNIQDHGGWTNPLISDWFSDYARVVFGLYGTRVKLWITINQPLLICDAAYNTGNWAPGILSPDVGVYLCNKHVLMAHAKAYRVYDEVFRSTQHGEVSLANLLFWFEAWTKNDEDIAELAREYCVGRYSHPIYSSDGGWPPVIQSIMAENSKRKGFLRANFPSFSQAEIKLVKGTFDFYAMNYYSSHLVRKADDDEDLSGWPFGDIPDLNAAIGWRPDWGNTAIPTMRVFPEGLRRQLKWLRSHYGDMRFIITENGFPSEIGLRDTKRIEYFEAHLKQLLLAMNIDGIHVTHYTAWSIMDGFEWVDGFSTRFGLYEVNFTDPLRSCIGRDSARYYATLIKNRKLHIKVTSK